MISQLAPSSLGFQEHDAKHSRIRSNLQEPLLTLDPRHIHQSEADSRGVIVLIEYLDLALNRFIRDIATFSGLVGEHNVEVDIKGSCCVFSASCMSVRSETGF